MINEQTKTAQTKASPSPIDARNGGVLSAHYREIGIASVAAAVRFVDPARPKQPRSVKVAFDPRFDETAH